MNISLVFPPFYLEPMYNLPPLGLIRLGTIANNSGHNVNIHDFVLEIRTKNLAMGSFIYEDCADIILADDPDVVGFSAQCTTYPAMVRIAEKVKSKKPQVKVVVGGHNASFVDKETLSSFPWIDAVVRGEGEITFIELIKSYKNGCDGAGIAGITYRNGSRIVRNDDRKLIGDLDTIPFADYSLVQPLNIYRDSCEIPRSIAILEIGRGCPHRCIYCSESAMWQRRTRTFSVKRLIDEMKYLHENYGAECFLLAYDQFTSNRKFVKDFCTLLIKEQLNHLPWYCISRLDTVDEALLRLMRDAGCESMCYGIDSGSKRTLAFIRKQIDEDILYERVRQTTTQGIVPTLSFVVGFPVEEKEDIDATLILALKTGVQGNSNLLFQMPTVLPGTELYELCKGNMVREVDTYFSLGMEFDSGCRFLSDDELINAYPLIFSSFYNISCKGLSLIGLDLIVSYFPLIANLYPKSFLLLSLALDRSAVELFFIFLNRLKEIKKEESLALSAADCYKYFTIFAQRLINESCISEWRHLPGVVKYETASLEAGKFAQKNNLCNIDIFSLDELVPDRKKNVIISEFDHNLPEIIEDMKAGIFKKNYPDEHVWIVFFHENKELEVTQINDFGKDFIRMCDGIAKIEDIAYKLHPIYGKDMGAEAFLKECKTAFVALADMRLLTGALVDAE